MISWPFGFYWAILICAVGVHKTNPQRIWEPALMLHVFIKHGFLRQFGLAWTVNHLAPLLVPLCWGKSVFVASFALFLCASFPLSISDCGCSALVNCWTPSLHGKDQYNEPF
ncbi:unnamed protein product [Urochloa decumbens]|uniref:Uncharacterized protein n=1 Tax=Urochloa decumbens TaxID=240449 RepID=A0ABC9CY67_9POAL